MTRNYIAWSLAIVLLCLPVYCQESRGVITGQVTDASGAVIAGAQIAAMQPGTNVITRAMTTDTGNYTIPSLPVGTYDIRVEAPGFRPFVMQGLSAKLYFLQSEVILGKHRKGLSREGVLFRR